MANTINKAVYKNWEKIDQGAASGFFENKGESPALYAISAAKPVDNFKGHTLMAGKGQRWGEINLWSRAASDHEGVEVLLAITPDS